MRGVLDETDPLIALSGFRLHVFLFNFSFFKASGLSLYFAPLGIVVVVL